MCLTCAPLSPLPLGSPACCLLAHAVAQRGAAQSLRHACGYTEHSLMLPAACCVLHAARALPSHILHARAFSHTAHKRPTVHMPVAAHACPATHTLSAAREAGSAPLCSKHGSARRRCPALPGSVRGSMRGSMRVCAPEAPCAAPSTSLWPHPPLHGSMRSPAPRPRCMQVGIQI
jgi:hypothetical protein